MFCSNCGKEISEKAIICVHCGCALENQNSLDSKEKTFLTTVLLCLFAGALGAHRFYTGHSGTGATMLILTLLSPFTLLISLIIVYIWVIVDLIRIVSGSFKTAQGKSLKQ
ncbi:MAG: TM2 domain-containing protein [Alphaproteobacteria bacterium]|nr:TM2 domain-containing protein [Alphaproteobacteria bacterium]